MRFIQASLLLLILAHPAKAQTTQQDMSAPVKVIRGPAGPELPSGAEIALLQGDPTKAEPFTIRVKMPKGYATAPHYHDTETHATVISGEISLGMGDLVDVAKLPILRFGDFITLSAKQPHFDVARTEVVVQLHGMGPLSITYVDPHDDPRRKPL